jgi:Protein of unknown function (DUF2887)
MQFPEIEVIDSICGVAIASNGLTPHPQIRSAPIDYYHAIPRRAVVTMKRDSLFYRSSTPIDRQGIIEIISRIMVYKFTNLSSQEVDEMLDIKVEETRVYQEAQERQTRSLALKMLMENIPLEQISRITEFTIAQLQDLRSQG